MNLPMMNPMPPKKIVTESIIASQCGSLPSMKRSVADCKSQGSDVCSTHCTRHVSQHARHRRLLSPLDGSLQCPEHPDKELSLPAVLSVSG